MNKETFITIGILCVVVALVALYVFVRSAPSETTQSDIDRSLHVDSAAYTDLSGNPIDLSQYDTRVRVINSWASWCPFCVQELPDFERLAQEFAADEVVVVAINRKEPAKTASRFLDTLAPMPSVVMALDPNDTFYRSIGGISMPETIFYDVHGNISFHKVGFMTFEEMRAHTKQALQAVTTE